MLILKNFVNLARSHTYRRKAEIADIKRISWNFSELITS